MGAVVHGQIWGRSLTAYSLRPAHGNVLFPHLPKDKLAWVKRVMRKALNVPIPRKGQAILKRLASTLEEHYPSAAGSLREGLDELLTLNDLGAAGRLWKTLRSTNTLESANERVRRITRNVKRYRSGSMALRWAVTGYIAAQPHSAASEVIRTCRASSYALSKGFGNSPAMSFRPKPRGHVG